MMKNVFVVQIFTYGFGQKYIRQNHFLWQKCYGNLLQEIKTELWNTTTFDQFLKLDSLNFMISRF